MSQVVVMWFRRAKHNLVVEGVCHACGACCRDLILVSGGRPLRSRREFQRLVEEEPHFARFRPHGLGLGLGLLRFTCEYLDGDGRCRDYAGRPALCRQYPNPRMLAFGAELPPGCGYRLVPQRSFSTFLARERKRRERRGWRRWLPFPG